jgi:hypothetical protein
MSEQFRDEDWLRRKYIDENLTQKEISDICEVTDVTISNWLNKFSIDTGVSEKTCHSCGNVYKLIGNHWLNGDCKHPELSQYQKDVFTGILMGDGHIAHRDRTPIFQLAMINKEFLEFLTTEIFPLLGSSVSLQMTGEEHELKNKETGFFSKDIEYNCKDIYSWHSVSHPVFEQYSEWYSSGEKVWPCEKINLTPTVLKFLYVCDGSCKLNSADSPSISIGMSNESERKQNVRDMFNRCGFHPTFEEYMRERGGKWMQASFSVEESKDMLRYMGEPLPGFEYKWRGVY